jgi:hypothetical protein
MDPKKIFLTAAVLVTLALSASPTRAEATRTAYNYAFTEIYAHLPDGTDQCGFVHGYVYVYDRLITKGNNSPIAYRWIYVLLDVDYCDKPIVKYHGSAVLTDYDHLVSVTKGGSKADQWSAWVKKTPLKVWNKAMPSDAIWLNLDLQWTGQDIFYYYASHTKANGQLTTNSQTDWCPATLTGTMNGNGATVGNLSFDLATQLRTRIVDTQTTVHQ